MAPRLIMTASVHEPHAIATTANPHFTLQKIQITYSKDPSAPYGTDESPKGVVTGAAERMRTRIDGVVADAMLRVDSHPQHQVRGGGARECIRGSNHECDDHPHSRGLLYV